MKDSFTKSTLITFFTRVATAFFTVVITALIARTLGPKGQGVYSLAVLFPIILLVFTSFGINPSSVFFIGKGKYSPKQIFSSNFVSNFVISILTILIGLAVIFFFNERFFPEVDKQYLFLSLFFIPLTLFFELGCQTLLGLQKIRRYNLVSFLQNLLFLILIFIFLTGLDFGVTVAILAQIFSLFAVTIMVLFFAYREVGGFSFKMQKEYFKDSFSYGIKVSLGGIFNFLHYRIDLFLINIFLNPIAVGFYYAAARLAEGIWLFSNSASIVLFPRVASEKNETNLKEFTPKVCRSVFFITLILVILLLFFSEVIITLFYTKDFFESIRPFQILLLGTLAISVWQIMSNDLSARGKPMINTYLVGASVIINIILNIFWIPKWGIEGAAFATAISYYFLLFATLIFYSKISGNKIKEIVFLQRSDFLMYKNILKRIKA
jgi:O-antigen/teichoic acid export membrane protein